MLYVASVLLVVVNVTAGVLSFGMSYLNEFVSQRVAYDLRNNLYDHLQRLSFAYHDRSRTGELMSRVTSDVDAARVFTGQGVLQIVNTVVLYVSVLALMFFLNWQLALLSLVTLPFLAVTAIQYGTRVRPLFSRMQRQWAQLTAVLQENVTGVRVVKAFAREDFEIDKFERENQVYLERNIAATRLQALVYPLMLFITSIGTIAIIWFGGQQVMAGRADPGHPAGLQRLPGPPGPADAHAGLHHRLDLPGHRLRRAPVRDPGRHVARRRPPRGAPRCASPRGGSPSTTSPSPTASRPACAAPGAGPPPVVQPVAGAPRPRPGSSHPGPAPRRRPGRAQAGRTRHGRHRRAGRVLQDITFAAEPEQMVALVGPTGVRQDHPDQPHPPLLRRHRRGRCGSTATTCATSTLQSLRAPDRDRDAGDLPVQPPPSAENIATGDPEAPDGGDRARPPGRRRRTTSSPSSRRATRP